MIGVQPHSGREAARVVLDLGGAGVEVEAQGLCKDLAHRMSGVERGVGVLEHHLNPAQCGPIALGGTGGQICAVKGDGAGAAWPEAGNGAHDGGFAAAGFADQP